MIPHQLQIKNFLSYGNIIQTINFDPYHLIYLSGKNGHGKSALLDALTWGIWGCARKTLTSVKPDLGLIRSGQSHMLVMVEFSCNNQRYKIRRELTLQGNKNHLNIEFGIFSTALQQWKPLTEKTIKQTQETIEQILGLSYESFINSAFLKQNCSNEFSKKSARDRKEIFATILGLGAYETLKIKALQKVKIEQSKLTTLNTFLEQITQTCLDKETLESNLLNIEKEKSLITEDFNSLNNQLRHYQNLEQQYNRDIMRHEQDNIRKKELLHEKELLHTSIIKTYQNLACDKKIIMQNSIESCLKQQEQYMLALTECQNKMTTTVAIQQEIIAIEKKLTTAYQTKTIQEQALKEHEAALLNLSLKINEYKTILDNSPSEEVKNQAEHEYRNLMFKKNYFIKILEQKKATYHKLIALRNEKEKEQTQVLEKITIIQQHRGQDPACPLCNQNLSATRKKFLQTSLEETRNQAIQQYNRIKNLLPLFKNNMLVLHEKTKKMEEQEIFLHQKLQKIKEQQKTDAKVTIERDRLLIKQQELARLLTEQKTIFHEQWANEESEYQKLQNKRTALTSELTGMQDMNITYQKIQSDIQSLNQTLMSYTNTIKEYKHKRNNLLELCRNMQSLKQHIQSIETMIDPTLITKHNEAKAIIERLKKDITLSTTNKDTIDKKLLELKTQLLHIEKLLERKEQLLKDIQETQQHMRDYQMISYAASKDGLQALLIEQAIPEIEHDANILLSKLTNNQTQLFIESLKDLKSGGTKETLDIKISDAMGIRPYEMFSGGEAFRIDLALRIAISKLLAKRAGTALQTLIIDEGFGSQDEDGLNAIMDAMYKIQTDFEKIIIVSHLPIMKDQFPVHFIVEKKPQGSIVQIKELC